MHQRTARFTCVKFQSHRLRRRTKFLARPRSVWDPASSGLAIRSGSCWPPKNTPLHCLQTPSYRQFVAGKCFVCLFAHDEHVRRPPGWCVKRAPRDLNTQSPTPPARRSEPGRPPGLCISCYRSLLQILRRVVHNHPYIVICHQYIILNASLNP